MKTTFKFFAAALAIVAAASCAKENAMVDNNENIEVPVELVEVSFSATIDSPADPTTKTTLSGLEVNWTEGDQILLYVPGDGYYWGTGNVGLTANYISGSLAGFNGSAPSADSYNAVYPYDAADLSQSNNQYYFFVDNTLASQTVRANDFSTTNWGVSNLALATGAVNGEKINFSNVLSHFKFSVATEGVRSIVISTSKAYDLLSSGNQTSYVGLGGRLAIRKSDGKFFIYGKGGITVTNSGVDFVVGETYYVAFPPFAMTDLTFTFKDADGNVLHTLTKSSFDPKSNTIYNLGSIELPKSYTASSTPIATASSLEPGKTYVIQNMGNSMYWAVVDGTLTLKSHDTSEPFTDDMIFKFWTGSGNYPTGYNSNKVGTFRAISQNEYYLNTSFGFNSYSAGNVLNLAFCNGWIDTNSGSVESGSDIDIYKVNSASGVAPGSSYPFYYNGSALSIETMGLGMGNNPRKWYIYEVTEN